MKLSVVVPCFNEVHHLGTQLEALAGQQWSEAWEVLVSDNGSTDGSLALLEEYRSRLPNLHVVDASDRRGTAHARNVGALAASSEALAFCDADDEIAPGWVAAMGEALSRHDFVAGPLKVDKFSPPWRKAPRHHQQSSLGRFRYPPFLPHSGAGNLGVKRAIHLAVGGFDETMKFLEDTDYCFKIQLAGTPLHFVPDAVVQIRADHELPKIYRKAIRNGEYHMLLYKRYRRPGMPTLSWGEEMLGWVRLVQKLGHFWTPAGRANWTWAFGWRIGQLKGCYRYRVWAV